MKSFIKQSHAASPLKYFFRRPRYPVLCCLDNQVFSATSERQFVRQLARYELNPEAQYDVIDVTGEPWTLHPDMMLLSPLTIRQRWTKLQLIRLVNSRANKLPDEPPYSERSLSAKRFDRIFHDLVAITNADGA
jgi:hypothetical protein